MVLPGVVPIFKVSISVFRFNAEARVFKEFWTSMLHWGGLKGVILAQTSFEP